MNLINYSKLKAAYANEEDISETILRLEQFDGYHLLRDAEEGAFEKKYPDIKSKQYKKWMNLCDGGYLFDTTLLSLNKDEESDWFDTLEDNNTEESYEYYNLPQGYFIIAIRSYGDPICLSNEDEKVYLWNLEEGEFTEIWDCFEDFLGDETDGALELISNGDIEPIPLKFTEE